MAANATEEAADAAADVGVAAVVVCKNREIERATAEAVRSVDSIMEAVMWPEVKQGMCSAQFLQKVKQRGHLLGLSGVELFSRGAVLATKEGSLCLSCWCPRRTTSRVCY